MNFSLYAREKLNNPQSRADQQPCWSVLFWPYPFVSYFYYRVDIEKYGAEATDILDGIAITLLSRIGEVSLERTPDYVPEKDPIIRAAIEKWRADSKR